MNTDKQRITPFLWFEDRSEEAANFYTAIFHDSAITSLTRYNKSGSESAGMPEGTAMTVSFTLEGQSIVALNGGPAFKFTPAISFIVNCNSTSEIDRLWEKLSEGGKVLMEYGEYPFSEKYGWLSDKFGLSWQLTLSKGNVDQKIVPSFMFNGNVCGRAEEAMNFYTSIFSTRGGSASNGNKSEIRSIFRYGPGQDPDKEGTIMFADFSLAGKVFAAMDSAHDHHFTFNESISFVVNCETQEEIDYYWDKLSAVPESEQCGWLKDRYGISWQVVPVVLGRLLSDPEYSEGAMRAMLRMKKIDIEGLKAGV